MAILISSAPSTVTLKLHWDLFPDWSFARQVTVTMPKGKTLPDGGEQTTFTAVEQRSVAVTTNETAAPALLKKSRTASGGHEMMGGVVSTTATKRLAVPTSPRMFVA